MFLCLFSYDVLTSRSSSDIGLFENAVRSFVEYIINITSSMSRVPIIITALFNLIFEYLLAIRTF